MTTSWNPSLYNQKHDFVYQYGESLVEELRPQPHEHVLDLGCGTGELTQRISESGAEVVGVDSSDELIATARQRFPDLAFQQQDVTQLLDIERYDAVFSNAVLHWVKDQKAVIEKVFQSLKPGGRLVAELGGQGNVQTIIDALRETLKQHGYNRQAAVEPWYFPSVGQYAGLLEQQGFRVAWMQHYARPTKLEDAESGITDWLRMFAGSFLEGITTAERNAVLNETQETVRPELYRDGQWYADYQRLRFEVTRPVMSQDFN